SEGKGEQSQADRMRFHAGLHGDCAGAAGRSDYGMMFLLQQHYKAVTAFEKAVIRRSTAAAAMPPRPPPPGPPARGTRTTRAASTAAPARTPSVIPHVPHLPAEH